MLINKEDTSSENILAVLSSLFWEQGHFIVDFLAEFNKQKDCGFLIKFATAQIN